MQYDLVMSMSLRIGFRLESLFWTRRAEFMPGQTYRTVVSR